MGILEKFPQIPSAILVFEERIKEGRGIGSMCTDCGSM
jgi:hypothetical protein